LEKAYREFGHDIGSDDTPLEAGLGFASDFNKEGGFIGKQALLKKKGSRPLTKRMVQLLLQDPDPLLYHNEPIYADDQLVGYTSSAMYGHTLGGAVALGFINHESGVTADFIANTQFEIGIGNQRYAADASLRPLYDAKGDRIKI
jgi:4-methylaminobutanoate oxidase (formaldehyde-forming)